MRSRGKPTRRSGHKSASLNATPHVKGVVDLADSATTATDIGIITKGAFDRGLHCTQGVFLGSRGDNAGSG